jgi:hypothetical protein
MYVAQRAVRSVFWTTPGDEIQPGGELPFIDGDRVRPEVVLRMQAHEYASGQ